MPPEVREMFRNLVQGGGGIPPPGFPQEEAQATPVAESKRRR